MPSLLGCSRPAPSRSAVPAIRGNIIHPESDNSAVTPDVVMVVDYFPPEPGNRARRMFERARFLAANGKRVQVVCPDRGDTLGPAPHLPDLIRVTRVPAWFGSFLPSLRYADLKPRVARWLWPLLPLLGYVRWAPAAALAVRRIGAGVLYTPNNPIMLHIVGLLARRRCAGWIAELRDPITNYDHSQRGAWGSLDGWFERQILDACDYLMFRPGIGLTADELNRRHPGREHKVAESPDYGLDLAEFRRASAHARSSDQRDRPVGLYAGNFYAGQTPAPLSQANRELRADASGADIRLFGRHAGRFSLAEGTEYRGEVEYWDLLTHYAAADFLIMYIAATDASANQFIPSKLAELVAARKPILGIGPTDSRAARIIGENRLGVVAPDNDPAALKGALRGILAMVSDRSYNKAFVDEVRDRISNEPSERAFLGLVERLAQRKSP